MNPGRNPGTAGIAALALAFHRAPARHADLLHGRTPLPPGMSTLLKLAGGSAPDPESAVLAPPDALRTASLFFIEQVLFHHDGNHYRVLGLEPGASTEQIKEHHRLLMRLFHPDRERYADDWKDVFATRINLAYTTLHDPSARRRYDAAFKPAPRTALPPVAARRGAVAHKKPARRRTPALPPWLLRHLPQWVLAGVALLAVALVSTVYVNNPPLDARAASPTANPASKGNTSLDGAPLPAQLNADAALARFVSSYVRGDAQALMALFDADAFAREANVMSRIRREHESLFQSTDWRHIAIDDMTWSREGDLVRGKGQYLTALVRKGETRLQTESGIFRIELLRRGDRTLIVGLDYQPGGRS